MKDIDIPKEVMHLHRLTCQIGSHYAISSISLAGDGKNATAVATDGHGIIVMTWACPRKFDVMVPGVIAKKMLSFCRADNAKHKDVVTVSSDKGMTTVTVTRMGIREDASVPLGVASMSGFVPTCSFPKWKELWITKKPIVEEQVIGVVADKMAMMFSALERVSEKGRGIKFEFTDPHAPMRFTVEHRDGDRFAVKAMLMPVEMVLT